jgi:SagB-type dehydrogenase family enzyme
MGKLKCQLWQSQFIQFFKLLATFLFLLLVLVGCSRASSPQAAKVTSPREISLPSPRFKSNVSLEEALAQRRSIRSYLNKDLNLNEISQLLWACQGITEPSFGGRTAPSAGALYPLEVYLVNSEGVFRYLPQKHALEEVIKEDVREELAVAALNQRPPAEAPVSFVITGVYERTARKYGARAERYVRLEAGHACQNLLLQAVVLNLGAVPIGAFYDEEVQKVLSIPSNHKPLYIVPVGYPAKYK